MNNKYRGKHIETGEWVYGYLIGDGAIVGEIVEWDEQYFCTEFWYKVDPETVGMITGNKDRDDKQIYEGDLLELECDCDPGDYAVCTHEPWVGKVVWHQETASFELKGTGEFGFVEFEDDYQDLYRVIGNIHDNPELLAPKEGADKHD